MKYLLLAVGMGALAVPARADVVQATPAGFELRQAVTIDVSIARAWAALKLPQRWWDKDHTYSDDSANLSLDAQAPGCFCERLPDGKGSVEHAHIVYVAPGRMMRLVGSLGPLQAEAVTGTLTFKLDPEGDSATRMTMTYVVGGYVRAGADTLAPKVDEVLALQLINLKTFAESATAAAPASKKPAELGR
ncbi:SRPBCC family protein [Sphingomonas hylomeconis]|uniref:ATPase n=1 Tax=Sphingomonas hylomeconis TaxID=1395958 RepID=A0ABV7SXC7_9SPHN|nr:ATPase [Sphingomonas hylomeconis]